MFELGKPKTSTPLKKLRPEILLHPNIPKPLHGTSPRTILGDDWWDAQRKQAYANSGNRCVACGVHKSEAKYHKWVEAHELYDINYKKGLMTFREIVALCHSCHCYIHSGRMAMMVQEGTMEESMMNDIIRHGNRILKAAGLKHPSDPQFAADWEDWRLVLYGKKYKGKFDTYYDWYDHYVGDRYDEDDYDPRWD